MPSYGTASKIRLSQCDHRLQEIFNKVIEFVDCSIITGHRDKAAQNEMHRTGKSQLQWPNGKHNTSPSLAIDAIPYPIDWKDRERMTLFAGVVMGIAKAQGVELRWGGDWDRDWHVKDNSFDDLLHFEIVE